MFINCHLVLKSIKYKIFKLKVISKLFCRFALDTAALLGGNEFLVSQIYEDRCQQSAFSQKERSTLEWALNRLWKGEVVALTSFNFLVLKRFPFRKINRPFR